MIDTIDPVSAMKLVFRVSILKAKRMHVGSPIVAAHTKGVIRFPVRRVMMHDMTVRMIFVGFGPGHLNQGLHHLAE